MSPPSGSKLEGYFRLPSVRHYLIVTTANRAVVHHQRNDAGDITTGIIREGSVRLDPPGTELAGLFYIRPAIGLIASLLAA